MKNIQKKLLLPLAILIGLIPLANPLNIFDENIDLPILIGSIIVIGAGLYTFWRERIVDKQIE